MSIPETIKSKRPTQFGAVEIRCIGGHYYIYLASSKWDAVKGRPQKVTGNYIYTFRDNSRRAELVGHYVERADKDYGEEEHVPMNVIGEVRMGYIMVC